MAGRRRGLKRLSLGVVLLSLSSPSSGGPGEVGLERGQSDPPCVQGFYYFLAKSKEG